MDLFSLEQPFAATAWRGSGMRVCTRAIVSVVLAAVLLAVSATLAQAQTTARVSAAGAKIWAPNFQSAIAEVPRGAILTIVGRRGEWVEVEVPDAKGGGRGFVFAANLDLTGKAFPAASFPAAPESPASPAPTPQVPSPVRNSPRSYGVRGFGQFGYTSFAAQQSFSAVLGQSGGLMLGGGAEVRFGAGLFVMGSIERFNKIGERAFVFGGEAGSSLESAAWISAANGSPRDTLANTSPGRAALRVSRVGLGSDGGTKIGVERGAVSSGLERSCPAARRRMSWIIHGLPRSVCASVRGSRWPTGSG